VRPTASYYRRQAEKTREIAANAENAYSQRLLSDVAQQYEKLADRAERDRY
jgi:hypothetical protein